MKLQKQIFEIKLYRKLRYRKGYGVHSPFVYSLITKVIEEKASFYAFDEIEKLKTEMIAAGNPLSRLTAHETQHRNYGALLFRIVNFFKCKNVLQLGSSTGIMSLYLAMASSEHCNCYALEERRGLLEAAKTFSSNRRLNRLHFIEGKYEEELKLLQASKIQADLLFINGMSDSLETEKTINLCTPFIYNKTILIIDNIMKNEKMKELWKKIKNNPQTRVSIDLCALGIIFFDDKLPKKHYKAYFDYGKKPNIYKNRRRRFYLVGRRKKSFKNQSAY
jgi:predicted O-methyltransferase YrrM